MTEINLNENCYSLPEIRDRSNVSLNTEFPIETELLIEKYEKNVCLLYPRDRTNFILGLTLLKPLRKQLDQKIFTRNMQILHENV